MKKQTTPERKMCAFRLSRESIDLIENAKRPLAERLGLTRVTLVQSLEWLILQGVKSLEK